MSWPSVLTLIGYACSFGWLAAFIAWRTKTRRDLYLSLGFLGVFLREVALILKEGGAAVQTNGLMILWMSYCVLALFMCGAFL